VIIFYAKIIDLINVTVHRHNTPSCRSPAAVGCTTWQIYAYLLSMRRPSWSRHVVMAMPFADAEKKLLACCLLIAVSLRPHVNNLIVI